MKRLAVPLLGIAVALIALVALQNVFADAPDPVGPAGVALTTITGQTCTTSSPCTKPGGGSATSGFLVSVTGGWYWGTHGGDCNLDRAGIGYSADWFDPNDAGFSLGASATVFGASTAINVGSNGSNGLNPADNVVHPVAGDSARPHDITDPAAFADWRGGCGTFHTNPPGTVAKSQGTWGTLFPGSAYVSTNISHLYAAKSDFTQFCVVTYDVHPGTKVIPGLAGPSGSFGGVPKSGDVTAGGSTHNSDNDVQKNVGAPFSSACTTFPQITTFATATQFAADGTATISDSATITGASPQAVGTITFNVFGPNNLTCTGAPVQTKTVPVTSNGTFASGNFIVTQAGTYSFTAAYSGDLAHGTPAVSSNCGDANESAPPTTRPTSLTTNAGPTVSFNITQSLSDSGTLSGGTSDATGLITFSLYGPDPTPGSNTADDCTILVGSSQVPVHGANGVTYTSDPITIPSAGSYHWIANYGGDGAKNDATANQCNGTNEDVTVIHPVIDVSKTPPSQSVTSGGTAGFTIVVTNIGDVTLFNVATTDAQSPNCARSNLGTLTPGQSTTYTCTSNPITVFPFVNVVFACGTDSLGDQVCDHDQNGGPPGPGCDPNAEANRCAGVTPEDLSSNQDPTPNDRATLTGAISPAGTFTFRLRLGSCSGAILLTDTENVTGNGIPVLTTNSAKLSALLGTLLPTTDGTYFWQVSYSGDTVAGQQINAPFSKCVESFTITNS